MGVATGLQLNEDAPTSWATKTSGGEMMTKAAKEVIAKAQATEKIMEKKKSVIIENKPLTNTTKKLCMCSPTTHPGSFKCRLHRASNRYPNSSSKEKEEAAGSQTQMSRFGRAAATAATGGSIQQEQSVK